MSEDSHYKICTQCDLDKDISEFSKNKNKPDGLQPYCKSCHNVRCKKYKAINRKVYREHSWKVYNIKNPDGTPFTWEDYKKLLESQKNHCATCTSTNSLCADHDHRTNIIRGILCKSCNLALGYSKDSEDVLKSLASYLTKGNIHDRI